MPARVRPEPHVRFFPVLLLAILSACPAWAGPVEVPIEIDGNPSTVPAFSIDGTAQAQPTDVIAVRDFLVTRGTEATLRFRTGPGRLWQIGADGHERLVAVVAAALRPGEAPDRDVVDDGTSYGGRTPETDVFLTLSDAEVAGLRGVRVAGWSAAIGARLASLDLANVAILVAGYAHEPVPPLPPKIRNLAFGGGPSGVGPDDLGPLAALQGLRLLSLGRAPSDVVTDLAPLASLAELRYLSVSARRVASLAPLSRLEALRVLDLAGCVSCRDLSFITGLKRLVVLDLAGTRVVDLEPVVGLADLRAVDARIAKVRKLPAGPLPALRELDLLGTPVSPEVVEAFRKAHPACRVAATYRDVLLSHIGAIDRVRVRTGGTCHRHPGETTIAEVTEPKEIEAILGMLRFDESQPPTYCMCCGDPTLELYRGRELRASLGFHHGVRLRWPGGTWPGDVSLADDAGERLSAWLAERGSARSKRERDEGATARAKSRRRTAREAELLPIDVLDELDPNDADAEEHGPIALRQGLKDAAALRLLAFRLIGCAAGDEGVAQIAAYGVLRAEPIDAVVASALAALADSEAARGVGYWILFHADRTAIPGAALDTLLERAGSRLLTDADPDVRGAAIQGLAEVGRPVAVPLLRKVLLGPTSPATPGAAAQVGIETGENLERVMDALIDLEDRDSLPRMREIAAGWPLARRARFEERVAKRFPDAK